LAKATEDEMTTISPVIACLAIGSGFIQLFAAMFPTAEILIVGAEFFCSHYRRAEKELPACEQIYFTAISQRHPDVKIKNAASDAIVWEPDWAVFGLCDPDDHDTNTLWKFADNNQRDRQVRCTG
jgi:hypothetical protein